MTGDSLHLLAIDVPLAFVLASPCLLFASTRKRPNAPLVVPAIVLFVLGLSSLYVALIESQSTTPGLLYLDAITIGLWRTRFAAVFAVFGVVTVAPLTPEIEDDPEQGRLWRESASSWPSFSPYRHGMSP